MRRRCAVFSCVNHEKSDLQGGDVSLYKFPSDPGLCEKWVEFCKSDKINEILVLQGVTQLRDSTFSVCSDHFEQPCFVNPRNPSQGVHKESIPTIIAGHPVLVSNFKQVNQIPDYVNLDALQRANAEHCDDNAVVEVLYEALEETAEPTGATEQLGTSQSRLKVEQQTTKVEQPKPYEEQPVAALLGILDPTMLACQCKERDEYEAKFYAERSRAVGLVQEFDDTRKRLSAFKKPQRTMNEKLRRTNVSIRCIKDKIRKLAEEYHTVVELDSSDDNEDYDIPGTL